MPQTPAPRTGQVIDPSWKVTPKHNLRFANELWKPVTEKVKRLKRAKYGTSVTDMLRLELARIAAETDAETIERLGLEKVTR